MLPDWNFRSLFTQKTTKCRNANWPGYWSNLWKRRSE